MNENDNNTPNGTTLTKIGYLQNEIANIAQTIERLSCATIDANDSRDAPAFNEAIGRLASLTGWYADKASDLAGGGIVAGDADQWFMPPIYLWAEEDEQKNASNGQPT